MSKGLRTALIGMGLFFILLGIFLNFQLYTSLTDDSMLHKYSYGAIGIGLDISKLICLILGIFLIMQATSLFITAGIVSLAICGVLSFISWAAGWGFALVVTQQYENQAFKRNAQVQSIQVSLDDAATEVNRLSQYANSPAVFQAQAKQNEIQTQLDALWNSPARNSLEQRTGQTIQAHLGGTCPGTSWYHKKYCPQIQKLESQMKQYKTIIGNHAAYRAAIAHKNTMIKELGQADLTGVSPESYMHPLFVGMGAVFNTSPQVVKYRLLLLTSAMIEFLGSMFFVMGVLLKGQTYSIPEIIAAEKQKKEMLAELLGEDLNKMILTDKGNVKNTLLENKSGTPEHAMLETEKTN
ncbi:hypothetical protein [Candidatus Parabeggiatoa sp. HSG14]|uniref:hypothetical protein n=1 Tax=Candidatus Parabeggiatoa sp. HSG14 TaxID=3055593 RepID=UPI0025A76FAC|nr:hypothetical protein [Thiotrichales bacterium HSG14]